MIKSLRKKHLQIWTLLAVVLPVGILSAWLVAPAAPLISAIQQESPAPLPVMIASKQGNGFVAGMRTNEQHTSYQLEWKNQAPLTVPSTIIYRVINHNTDITKNEMVGRIEARGNYLFPINTKLPVGNDITFLVYDFIHERVIDSLDLKISK